MVQRRVSSMFSITMMSHNVEAILIVAGLLVQGVLADIAWQFGTIGDSSTRVHNMEFDDLSRYACLFRCFEAPVVSLVCS